MQEKGSDSASTKDVSETLLGKDTVYPQHYDASVLTPLPRQRGVTTDVWGEDIWNAFELSWLRQDGVPEVAIGTFRVPASTPCLIESKSFKLYLNSLNQMPIDSIVTLRDLMARDLSAAAGGEVEIQLSVPNEEGQIEGHACVSPTFLAEQLFAAVSPELAEEEGNLICLDRLAMSPPSQSLNVKAGPTLSEVVFSNLLKTNCPVTGQPDWATVFIAYRGPQIDRAALLNYLVGLRQHQDFHEHCVEQIYARILADCQPERLLVYARYTRRGGLDINPWRGSFPATVPNLRLARQ